MTMSKVVRELFMLNWELPNEKLPQIVELAGVGEPPQMAELLPHSAELAGADVPPNVAELPPHMAEFGVTVDEPPGVLAAPPHMAEFGATADSRPECSLPRPTWLSSESR